MSDERLDPWERPKGQPQTSDSPARDPWEQVKGVAASKSTESDQKPSRLDSIWEGLKTGVIQAGQEVAHLATRMPTILPGAEAGRQRMEADISQRSAATQRAFQQDPATLANPRTAELSRIAGNIIPGMAAGAAMGPLGAAARGLPMGARLAQGALGGAMGGAMQPVDPHADWETEKTKQIMLGAGVGAAVPGVGGMLAPQMPNLAQFEAAAGRMFPPLARFLNRAEERTVDGFDRAVVGQALEPIGGSIPANMKAGHGLIDHALSQIEGNYKAIEPNISLNLYRPDNLAAAIPQAVDKIVIDNHLTDAEPAFRRYIAKTIMPLFDQHGHMKGDVAMLAREKLGEASRRLHGTTKDDLGEAYDNFRGFLGSAITKQNPTYGPVLKKIDQSYAMLKRAIMAGARERTDTGKFSPNALHAVIAKQSGPNAMQRGLAFGDGLLQGYSEMGMKLLGGGGPEPGSLGRAFLHMLNPKVAAAAAVRGVAQPIGRAAKASASVTSPGVGAIADQIMPPDRTPKPRDSYVSPAGP